MSPAAVESKTASKSVSFHLPATVNIMAIWLRARSQGGPAPPKNVIPPQKKSNKLYFKPYHFAIRIVR